MIIFPKTFIKLAIRTEENLAPVYIVSIELRNQFFFKIIHSRHDTIIINLDSRYAEIRSDRVSSKKPFG